MRFPERECGKRSGLKWENEKAQQEGRSMEKKERTAREFQDGRNYKVSQKGCISPVKQNRCSYPTSKTCSIWVTEKLAALRRAAENWLKTSKANTSEIPEDL